MQLQELELNARAACTLNLQAALASKWKERPRDALDTMILITGLKLPQVSFLSPQF